MLRSDKFVEAGEPCLKQYRALTHVTTILKNNYTSVRNTWECRSGQLHLQIKFSRTRYFLLSFLTDCHRTGPEQTMKCAEHNLLRQQELDLEEVIRTATAHTFTCQGAPNIHNKKLHLQEERQNEPVLGPLPLAKFPCDHRNH